jgi:hypothetical protein
MSNSLQHELSQHGYGVLCTPTSTCTHMHAHARTCMHMLHQTTRAVPVEVVLCRTPTGPWVRSKGSLITCQPKAPTSTPYRHKVPLRAPHHFAKRKQTDIQYLLVQIAAGELSKRTHIHMLQDSSRYLYALWLVSSDELP